MAVHQLEAEDRNLDVAALKQPSKKCAVEDNHLVVPREATSETNQQLAQSIRWIFRKRRSCLPDLEPFDKEPVRRNSN